MNKKKILGLSVAMAVSSFSNLSFADSTEDLIDALVTKGVLTEDEGALLSKGRKAEKKKRGRLHLRMGLSCKALMAIVA